MYINIAENFRKVVLCEKTTFLRAPFKFGVLIFYLYICIVIVKTNIMEKKDTLFKCWSSGDSEDNMLFVNGSHINSVTAKLCDNKYVKLFVEYYDDEFCVNTLFICDKVEQINE